jgi:DNA/RNA endonuclease G (NUC1)
VEAENSDYYYAHHTVTDVKNSKGENARNYTVCYSANHHCPVWVAAPRHKFWTGSAGKAGYSVDPDIPSTIQPSSGASISDGSYNRGHMLGNADRSRSAQMRKQVSYYTNIALQKSSTFNTGGGAWNNLEDHIDTFAESDTLYMVVGSYFDAWTDKYGNSKPPQRVNFGGVNSSVPTMFWAALLRTKESAKGKAVWNCSAEELRCAAFVISHAMPKGHKPAANDMISVSELEELVGVEFFPNVPNAPKSSYKASDWDL